MPVDPNIISAVKDKAEGLFSKGRYDEALSAYGKIEGHGEKDPRVFLRMGDIARKIEDTRGALGYYKKAAESFVRLGFAIKAIAVCRMIINIDPSEEETNRRLAELCGNRSAANEKPQEVKPPKTPLFSDFTEAEFVEVIKKLRTRDLSPGELLFNEGDPGDSIFIIAEGAVEVTGRAKDSSSVHLASLSEGSIFGEFGFFLNSKRTTDVKATEKAHILELTKEDLNDIISKHGRVEAVLFDFYKERVVDRLMALSEVFRPLTENDRKEVIRTLSLEKFPAKEIITKEGDKGDTMFLIKTGRVSVWVKDKAGSPLFLTGLEEGDFFGEIALATSRPRAATVIAETPLELVVFSRPMIKDILMKYPAVKDVLERVIKERVVDIVKARASRTGLV